MSQEVTFLSTEILAAQAIINREVHVADVKRIDRTVDQSSQIECLIIDKFSQIHKINIFCIQILLQVI